MKRDISVTCALVILLIWCVGQPFGLPSQIEMGSDQPLPVRVFGVFGMLAILRLVVLFFQTLIFAAHNARPDSKTALIVGHLLLGPLVSVPYYYASRRRKVK